MLDIQNSIDKECKLLELKTFESIKIGLASPEKIRSWSYGAVEKLVG